jgi:hypothetical protein
MTQNGALSPLPELVGMESGMEELAGTVSGRAGVAGA